MNQKREAGDLLIWVITVGLLLFTGFRSVHLVSSTLPADAQILAFAALAALDFGALGWLYFANHGARGKQRIVAVMMVMVDLAGVTAALIADTALIANPDAARDLVQTVSLWVVPVIVAVNIMATFAVTVLDPARELRDAEREVDEALQYHLADALKANASRTAAEAVPDVLASRLAEMVAAFQARGDAKRTPTRNGHKPEPVALNSDGAPVPKAERRKSA